LLVSYALVRKKRSLDIPGVGGALPSVRLAANVWILVLIAQVKAEIVNNISSILDDVGPLLQLSLGSVAAQDLKFGHMIRVGCGRQPGENARLGEEEGSGANGEQGPLAGGIILLNLCEGIDEGQRLGLVLQDIFAIATEDDENIKVLQALMGFFEADLGADDNTLG
jgi:hypothetical protein